MSEQPQPQRIQQTMPEEGGGWHRVNAGPHLHIMFNPNRLAPTYPGKRDQRPFPFNAYYRAKKKRPISTRTITSS